MQEKSSIMYPVAFGNFCFVLESMHNSHVFIKGTMSWGEFLIEGVYNLKKFSRGARTYCMSAVAFVFKILRLPCWRGNNNKDFACLSLDARNIRHNVPYATRVAFGTTFRTWKPASSLKRVSVRIFSILWGVLVESSKLSKFDILF